MPLTKTGRKVLSAMREQYGAKKGKQVFYASINKRVAGSRKWHGGRKGNGILGYKPLPGCHM